MTTNKVRDLREDGRPVLHGWLSVGNPFSAEIMAARRYNVTIDAQRGALDCSSGGGGG